MKYKRNFLAVFALAAAAAAALSLSGCVPPENGVAFSPDGKKVAFVTKNMDGITIRDIGTGETDQVYKSPEGAGVFSLFWPPEKDAIFFVEIIASDCREKTDISHVFLKKYDPADRSASPLVVKDFRCDENPFNTGLLPFITNFDPRTMSLEISGIVIQVPGNKASPYKSLAKSGTGETRLNFALAPDGKRAAYLSVRFSGKTNCNTKLSLRLFDFSKNKSVEIEPPACAKDWPFFSAKWQPDSGALYYIMPIGSEKGLQRYDVAAGRAKTIFKQRVTAFEPFPDSKRLLVLYDSAGSPLASFITDGGATEKTFPVIGAPGSLYSLRINKDGAYAAALYGSSAGKSESEIYLPVLYNLADLSQQFIITSPDDNLNAAGVYYNTGRYDLAIPYYEKAGPDGAPGAYLSNYYLHRDDEAASAYTKLINIYSAGGADPHFTLGNTFRELGENDLAQSEYLNSSDENMGTANYLVAGLQNNEKRTVSFYQKSVDAFKKAGCYMKIKQMPKECVPQLLYADAAPYDLAYHLKKAGKNADAVALLESFPKDFPRTDEKYFQQAHSDLAFLYKSAGEYRKAYDALKPVADWQAKQSAAWKKAHKSDVDAVNAQLRELAKKIGRPR